MLRASEATAPSPERSRTCTDRAELIHVHAFPLDIHAAQIGYLETLLDPDERSHVDRFNRNRLKARWIVGRGRLKQILSRYCDYDAKRIRFAEVANGKPTLQIDQDAPRLHFNLSHSGDLGVVAITRVAPVGVDIEHVREIADLDGIAARFFSPDEQSQLGAIPASERQSAFFRCWTRKEAVIKATGEGLAARLDSFAVSLSRQSTSRLLSYRDDERAAQEWQLHHLEPRRGYVGAVAIRSLPATVLVLHYEQLGATR